MIETNTIPGYRIIRQLGQGGSATTYLAIQLSFEREVALKIMSPTLNADPTFAMRFVREARIVAQMHHASIVPVFDVGEHRPFHYLSMEYLPGGDLRQRIVERRSSVALALDVCMAICSALEIAHRKGFIHRDIKPQNILFREDGAPVLTDFGIARAIDVGTSLTVAGMFVGTPAYMSPEQVKGLDLDGRTDLYSLGMVFYEMLTGAIPFRTDSDSALSIAMKHLSEVLPPLPPEHERYQPIVDRLTVKDRDLRFANATEVLHAFRSLSGGEGGRVHTLVGSSRHAEAKTVPISRPAANDAAATLVTPKAKSWSLWSIGAAAGAVGAAIVLGVFVGRPAQTPTTDTAQIETPLATAVPAAGATASDNSSAMVTTTVAVTPDAAGTDVPPTVVAQQPVQASELVATTGRVAPTVEQPRESAAVVRQRRIQTLLAQAASDIEKGALTSPAKENAADRYKAVLEMDPANADAKAGLQRMANTFEATADRTRRANDIEGAQTAIDQLRSVQPDHPRLAKLQADVADRKISLDKRGRRSRDKATEHISRADQVLARTPLVVRVVADAHDHYDAAMQLAPETPGLVEMKERIVAAYATAARYEMARNEPKRALNVINYARKRNITTPELEEIERSAAAQR